MKNLEYQFNFNNKDFFETSIELTENMIAMNKQNNNIEIYVNKILNKEIYLIIFNNERRSLAKATFNIQNISKKNFTIKETGINAFTFIETERTDNSKLFTGNELFLSQLMFMSFCPSAFDEDTLTALTQYNVKEALKLNPPPIPSSIPTRD